MEEMKEMERLRRKLDIEEKIRKMESKNARKYLESLGINPDDKEFSEGDEGKTVYCFFGLKWHKTTIVVVYHSMQLRFEEKIHDFELGGGYDLSFGASSPYLLSEKQYKQLLIAEGKKF